MIEVRIIDISKQVSSGLTPLRSNKAFWDEGVIPWVKTEQIGEKNIYFSNEKISQIALETTSIKVNPINTLSIAMYGEGKTRGSVSILKAAMTTNQACCNIVIDPTKGNYEYVYYFLKTQYLQLRNLSSGVRNNLNSNDIKSFKIRLPNSLLEQSQIAKVLSDLDSKIELNNRINTELEAMAKLIYEYWFVQFDFPFDFAQGKPADDNSNPKDVKPYKSSGGKMVWNTELKREIPEGWEVKELKDMADITMGQSPPGESYNENSEGTVFYQGCTDFGNRFPTIRKFTTMPTRFANEGDLLLSVRAPVGAINISKEYCCIGRGLASLAAKNGQKTFLFGAMQNLKQIFDRRNVDGTTFGAITKDDLFTLKVVVPVKSVLNKFHSITIDSFNKQNKCELENIQLSSLRDWLLPMLMNGQVRVKERQ
jgi:type I restriction enzyme S subunit